MKLAPLLLLLASLPAFAAETLSTDAIRADFKQRPAGDKSPRSVIPDMLIDTPVIEAPEDPVLHQAFDRMTK